MMQPISAPRAFWLLTRLRLLRLRNLMGSSFRIKKKAGAGRGANAGKASTGWVLSLLVGAVMLFAMTHMSSSAVLNMQCALDPASSCAALPQQARELARHHAAAADLLAAPFAPAVFNGVALVLGLVLLVAVLVPLSSKAMAAADWDLEWLVTLPVQRKTLLWARVIERSFANPTGMLAIFPVCAVIAWHSGARWSAPLLALPPAIVLLMLAAMLGTVVDTGLRLRLAPSQLRNLQATISIISMPLVYLVMSFGMSTAKFSLGLAAAAPATPWWTPLGLAVEMLNTRDPARAALCALLLAVQGALLLWLGMQLMHRMLLDGVVAGGARESSRKAAPRRAAAQGQAWGRAIGTPLQRRELRLLGRDRNFLAQSLIVPLAVVASQLLLNGKINQISELGANPVLLTVTAFGLGAYVLMLSAFQAINTEGHALWMLYTFPRTLHGMLKEKAQLWAVLAMGYPLLLIGVGVAGGSAALDAHFAARIVLALAGIPLFAAIAVSLGVWASDPLSPNPQQRIKPTFFYLYTLLSSAYGFAVFSDVWHIRLAILVLMSALAFALWQKAHDGLPYLLDPAAAPPPRVSLSDGLIAAILFFCVQLLVLVIVTRKVSAPAAGKLFLAFSIAGAVTWLLARFMYWRSKASGVPTIWPQRPLAALAWGVGLALPAIAMAAAYLAALRHFNVPLPHGVAMSMLWVAPLAVLAAPLFEEFIFRGLIFKGMQRSMPLLAAMAASAAIFAVVHPPVSVLPVFVLGLCTAYAAHRSKALLAPMLTHAIYNGAILFLN